MNYYSLFIFYFFLGCSVALAQISQIDLPSYDVRVNITKTPFDKLFVNQDGEVKLNGKSISILEVPRTLYEGIPQMGSYTFIPKTNVHLYIDKDVKYSVVDSIKTAIASTGASRTLYYRSSLKDSPYAEVFGIKSKNHLSYFNMSTPKYMFTQQALRERDSIIKLDGVKNLPPPPTDLRMNRVTSIEKALYSIQQDAINEAMKDKNCGCFVLRGDGLYIGQDKEVSLNSADQVLEAFKKFESIFLRFDENLTYEQYFEFLKVNEQLKKELRKLQGFELIEISNEIETIHKATGVKVPPCY